MENQLIEEQSFEIKRALKFYQSHMDAVAKYQKHNKDKMNSKTKKCQEKFKLEHPEEYKVRQEQNRITSRLYQQKKRANKNNIEN